MHAIIPDTIQGALILSVIDFFLSFFIIAGIGVVLAAFPLLNRATAAREEPKPVSVQKEMAERDAAEHIAVITAAVYATMAGAYRIVSIEPAPRHGEWITEGRLAHHTSHDPRSAR
ncbi:MAG: hypothetical protein U1E63_16365 [Burkholderiales bacterium]